MAVKPGFGGQRSPRCAPATEGEHVSEGCGRSRGRGRSEGEKACVAIGRRWRRRGRGERQAFLDAGDGWDQGYGCSRPAGQITLQDLVQRRRRPRLAHARRGWGGEAASEIREVYRQRGQDRCRTSASSRAPQACYVASAERGRIQALSTACDTGEHSKPQCAQLAGTPRTKATALEASSALTCTAPRAPSPATSDALPARQGLTKMRGGGESGTAGGGESGGRAGCTERAAEAAAAVLAHCTQLPASRTHADP